MNLQKAINVQHCEQQQLSAEWQDSLVCWLGNVLSKAWINRYQAF